MVEVYGVVRLRDFPSRSFVHSKLLRPRNLLEFPHSAGPISNARPGVLLICSEVCCSRGISSLTLYHMNRSILRQLRAGHLEIMRGVWAMATRSACISRLQHLLDSIEHCEV
jgi:hypothetical protein